MTEVLMAYAGTAAQGGGGPRMDVREGRMIIAPALAARILREMAYPHQRPSTKQHVEKLAHYMRTGAWSPGSQIAFGRQGDRLYLVNGQHRMNAVAAVGRGQDFQVVIVDCETEADLRALYYRFDVDSRPRSDREILNSVGVAETFGVSKTLATCVYRAAPIIAGGFTSSAASQKGDVANRTVDGHLLAAQEWWATAKTLNEIVEHADPGFRPRLKTTSIVAVALVTLKYAPGKAEDFWRGVAQDAPKGDARRTFRDMLIGRELRNHPFGGLFPCAAAATAWNAFAQGRTLAMIKVFPDATIKIRGTPYTIGAK